HSTRSDCRSCVPACFPRDAMGGQSETFPRGQQSRPQSASRLAHFRCLPALSSSRFLNHSSFALLLKFPLSHSFSIDQAVPLTEDTFGIVPTADWAPVEV